MNRSLTAREWILLALLGVIALVSCYLLLFYNPVTQRRDDALAAAELCRMDVEAAQVRLAEKQRMEQVLDDLFAKNPNPVSLAPYDNLQPVMFELHGILSAAQDYSLSFRSVDAADSIVRRGIALSFTSGSYDGAREILRQLHDSAYRCMVDGLSLSLGSRGGPVSVSATLVYFECQ